MEVKMKLRDLQTLGLPRKDEKGQSIQGTIDTILCAKVTDEKQSYWLTRVVQKLMSELKSLDKKKDTLVAEYMIDAPVDPKAPPLPEGKKPRRILDPLRMTEVNKKWEDMLDSEVTFEINSKIKLSWLKGIEINNGDMILLDVLIDSTEAAQVPLKA